jgi:transposase
MSSAVAKSAVEHEASDLAPSTSPGASLSSRRQTGLVAAGGEFCYSCPLPKRVGYKRNGTTTLFAALNMLDGTAIGECMLRHRHREFLRFLKTIDQRTPPNLDLHLIVDNYATHKTPAKKRWLKRHSRFHLHFTPTSGSWLNMVERFFAETTRKRIRGGVFKSVDELKQAIIDYLDTQALRLGQLIVRRWIAVPPRDCSPRALLRPHNDGLLHSNQKKGVVDEFHTESNTIQILAKVGYPIAGDIRSA